ncbi:MAG: CRISPR-associated endonuclease Cas1 [Bryobacterales bacterium]|nr:CRISPR-associated endonuclease Cas1 [Bryobacterales bacterium]
MSTLYLDHSNLGLSRDGESLAIRHSGQLIRRVPLRLLETVVVKGNASLEAGALTAMARYGCSLVLLPRGPGAGDVLLTRSLGPNSMRRLRQYAAVSDAAACARIAGLLLRAKFRGHARLLFRARNTRPELGKELGDAIAHLSAAERQIRQSPEYSLARLLGVEGAAAAAFFAGYQRLFAPGLAFTGRNRRPPRDPVNACLSLAYTLLHAESVAQILAAGLDPSLGFYHQPLHGRESLACDLVELLRPAADEWVLKLFRERRIQAGNFRHLNEGCLLGKAGRHTFYEAFEELRPQCRMRLKHALRLLIRELRDD